MLTVSLSNGNTEMDETGELLEICFEVGSLIKSGCKKGYGFDVLDVSVNGRLNDGGVSRTFTLEASLYDEDNDETHKSTGKCIVNCAFTGAHTITTVYRHFFLLVEYAVFDQDCSRIIRAIS